MNERKWGLRARGPNHRRSDTGPDVEKKGLSSSRVVLMGRGGNVLEGLANRGVCFLGLGIGPGKGDGLPPTGLERTGLGVPDVPQRGRTREFWG